MLETRIVAETNTEAVLSTSSGVCVSVCGHILSVWQCSELIPFYILISITHLWSLVTASWAVVVLLAWQNVSTDRDINLYSGMHWSSARPSDTLQCVKLADLSFWVKHLTAPELGSCPLQFLGKLSGRVHVDQSELFVPDSAVWSTHIAGLLSAPQPTPVPCFFVGGPADSCSGFLSSDWPTPAPNSQLVVWTFLVTQSYRLPFLVASSQFRRLPLQLVVWLKPILGSHVAPPCFHLFLPPTPSTQLTDCANFQLELPQWHLAAPAKTQPDL